jgi:hypothetical protein
MAIVPDRRELVKSPVQLSFFKSIALATMAALCFSLYGAVVVAKYNPSTSSVLLFSACAFNTPELRNFFQAQPVHWNVSTDGCNSRHFAAFSFLANKPAEL